jgi:hypothetical protein
MKIPNALPVSIQQLVKKDPKGGSKPLVEVKVAVADVGGSFFLTKVLQPSARLLPARKGNCRI